MPYELRTFGRLQLTEPDGDRVHSDLGHSKRSAVLAYLGSRQGEEPVSREELLAILWPEHGDQRARNALRVTLTRLRRDLPESGLGGAGQERLWLDADTIVSDARKFTAAIDQARFGSALKIYRGAFLEEFRLSSAPPFMKWVDEKREHYRKQAYEAAVSVGRAAQHAGDLEAAESALRRARSIRPLREDAARELMRVLARRGKHTDALQLADGVRRRREKHLGLSPTEEFQKLVDDLQSSDSSSTVPGRPGRPGVQGVRKVASRPAVAVLPFRDLSPDADRSYFARGLAEELINALTQLSGLRVVAQTSSFPYRQPDRDRRSIGDDLGVTHLLEGSVRRSGDDIRVTAQLVDAERDHNLWSNTFDRTLTDVLDIQEEIAASVVDELQVELLGKERKRLRRIEGVDPEAYDLFLKGRDYWNRRYEVGLETALDFFRRSLEADPEFALARSSVALVLHFLASYGLSNPETVRERILELSRGAVGRSPDLPEPHATLGLYRVMFEYDWEEGLRHLRRATEIDSSYARAYTWLGMLKTLRMARPTGTVMDSLKRAVELAPSSEWIRSAVGHTCLVSGRIELAMAHYERALEIEPESVGGQFGRSMARAAQDEYDEALDDARRVCSLTNRAPFFIASLGGILALAGREKEARSVIQELKEAARERYVDPIMLAMVEAPLGEIEEALDRVEACVEHRSPCLFGIMLQPPLQALWNQDRWREILEPVGFRPT